MKLAIFITACYFVGAFAYKISKTEKESVKNEKVSHKIVYIGDSGTPLISDTSLGPYGIGWTCENLKSALRNVKDTQVTEVVLSIGTNDLYSEKTDVEGTIISVKKSYPKSRIVAVPGSYGWGNARNIDPLKYLTFYRRMKVETVSGFGYTPAHPSNKEGEKIKKELKAFFE